MRATVLVLLCLVAAAGGCGRGERAHEAPPPPPADALLGDDLAAISGTLAEAVLSDRWINDHHDKAGSWPKLSVPPIADRAGAVPVEALRERLVADLAKGGERLAVVDDGATHVLAGVVRREQGKDGVRYLVDVTVTDLASGDVVFRQGTERLKPAP